MDFSAMFQTWINAVTKPNEASYQELANSPHAKTSNALIWLFIAALVGGLLGGLLGLVFSGAGNAMGEIMSQMQDVPPELREAFQAGDAFSAGGGLVGVLCGAPIGALVGVLFFFIGAAIQNWIARMFGGVGDLEKFVFVNAAYSAPIGLATSLLSNIPVLNCLTIFISFYSLYLNYLSIRTVHQLTPGKSIMVILIPALVFCLFFACLFFLFAAVLAPAIGGVIEQINQ